MARRKKVVTGPEGRDLKEFQARFATEWKRFVDSAAYQAGAQFLRNRKLEGVAILSPEQIEQNSKQILGDLRGYLQHEEEMSKLYEMTDFTLPFEEETEYLSPEQEAEQEQLRAKFRAETKKARYA